MPVATNSNERKRSIRMQNPIARSLGGARFGLLLNFCHLYQVILCYVSIGRIAASIIALIFSALMTVVAFVELQKNGMMPEALESSQLPLEIMKTSPWGPYIGDSLDGEPAVAMLLYLQADEYFGPAASTVSIFSILAIAFLYFKFLRSQTRARGAPLAANDTKSRNTIDRQLASLRTDLPKGVALRLGTQTSSQISALGRRSIQLSLQDFIVLRKNFLLIRFKVCHEAYHLHSFDSFFATLSRPIVVLSALATSALACFLFFLGSAAFLSGLPLLLSLGLFFWFVGRAIYRFFPKGHHDFLSLKELLADRFAAARCGEISEASKYFRQTLDVVAGEDHPEGAERRASLETGLAVDSPARLLTNMMLTCAIFYYFPRWLGVSKIDSVVPGLGLWVAILPFVLCAASMSPRGGTIRIVPGMAIFLLYLLATLGLPLVGLKLQVTAPETYFPIVSRRLEIDLALFFATPLMAAGLQKYLIRGVEAK